MITRVLIMRHDEKGLQAVDKETHKTVSREDDES